MTTATTPRTPQPRGLRNNNPLNIRVSHSAWQGKVTPNTDGSFEQFRSIEMGIRAAFIIVRRYIRFYHLDTPAGIIARWAPASENNTERYITTVCDRAQLARQTRLRYNDCATLCRLLQAMAFVEVGQSLPLSLFESAWALI